MQNEIHPTAIISDSAKLGQGNKVGPFVVVEDGVEIGDNNELMQGVCLKRGTRLGNGNRVHEHAVIGGLPQDLGFDTSKQTFVEIGNNNSLREYVTIHRATRDGEATRIGNDCMFMVSVHIGHDCQLGSNIVIAPSSGIGGHVHINDRAFISGGVMVHQRCHIGRQAMIGGNSKITQDVLPFMMTDGNPATVHGLNVVGLKRAGYTASDLKQLKQAYRIIFRSGHKLDDIILQLQGAKLEPLTLLAEFISNAKRGFHRENS